MASLCLIDISILNHHCIFSYILFSPVCNELLESTVEDFCIRVYHIWTVFIKYHPLSFSFLFACFLSQGDGNFIETIEYYFSFFNFLEESSWRTFHVHGRWICFQLLYGGSYAYTNTHTTNSIYSISPFKSSISLMIFNLIYQEIREQFLSFQLLLSFYWCVCSSLIVVFKLFCWLHCWVHTCLGAWFLPDVHICIYMYSLESVFWY